MSEASPACRICEKRRPKRYCPGVSGDICPVCCGIEREVTVNCPLDCPFLQKAREYDPLPEVDPRQFPNSDLRVDESFLRQNEALLILIASSLAASALETGGVIDNDVKDALDSLVRTYRTLQSGLIAELRPDNVLARKIYVGVRVAVDEARTQLGDQTNHLRDADILRVLVFLQHMEIQHNNGRPKGRAFIDFLRGFFAQAPEPERDDLLDRGDGGGLILMP